MPEYIRRKEAGAVRELSAENRRKYARFDNMPDGVLAAFLAADAQARPDKQMSAAALLYITDLLAARRESDAAYQERDVAAAKQDFLAYYYPWRDEPPLYDFDDAVDGETAGKNAKHGRRWLRYAASVAAVLLFVLAGTATAAAIAYAPWPDMPKWSDGGFWPAADNGELPGDRGLLNAAAWDEQTKTELAALYLQNVDAGMPNIGRAARRQLLWQICEQCLRR